MCIVLEKKKRGKTVQSEPLLGIWKFTNAVIIQILMKEKKMNRTESWPEQSFSAGGTSVLEERLINKNELAIIWARLKQELILK